MPPIDELGLHELQLILDLIDDDANHSFSTEMGDIIRVLDGERQNSFSSLAGMYRWLSFSTPPALKARVSKLLESDEWQEKHGGEIP